MKKIEKINEISCTIPLESAFTHILFNLSAQGYSHIYSSYSGSGDDGAIDEIILIKRGNVIEKDNEFPFIKDEEEYAVVNKDLLKLLSDKIYTTILNDATNWYNNEGGGGKLFISTDDGTYKCDHYYNVTESIHEELDGKFGDN